MTKLISIGIPSFPTKSMLGDVFYTEGGYTRKPTTGGNISGPL